MPKQEHPHTFQLISECESRALVSRRSLFALNIRLLAQSRRWLFQFKILLAQRYGEAYWPKDQKGGESLGNNKNQHVVLTQTIFAPCSKALQSLLVHLRCGCEFSKNCNQSVRLAPSILSPLGLLTRIFYFMSGTTICNCVSKKIRHTTTFNYY